MKRAILLLTIMAVVVLLGSGVAAAAVKFGTDRPDEIFGTNGEDVLYGRGGSDSLEGCGGDDVLYGGDGGDLVGGDGLCRTSGDDKLYGGDGDDEVFSFPGDDVLYGGSGNDLLFEGRGENVIYGGSGSDFIQATAINPDRPGNEKTTPKKKDLVFCGSGRDTVAVDPGRIDFVAPDCEKVLIRTGRGDIGL